MSMNIEGVIFEFLFLKPLSLAQRSSNSSVRLERLNEEYPYLKQFQKDKNTYLLFNEKA